MLTSFSLSEEKGNVVNTMVSKKGKAVMYLLLGSFSCQLVLGLQLGWGLVRDHLCHVTNLKNLKEGTVHGDSGAVSRIRIRDPVLF
jgi:hypothetical protein